MIDLSKWIQVVKVGKHTVYDKAGDELYSVNITQEDIQQMAESYSTNYHEAFWVIGHPWDLDAAPALAWVGEVKAEGDSLYVKNSFVSPEFEKLVAEKKYKKMSIMMTQEKLSDGKVTSYLHNIAMTNANLCKFLESLEKAQLGRITDKHERDYVQLALPEFSFTDDKPEPENTNQNQNQDNMGKTVKDIASSLGIKVDGLTDDQIADKVIESHQKLSQDRIDGVIDAALKENKFDPAQKDKYASLLAADFDSTKAIIDGMKAGDTLDPNQVPQGDGGEKLAGLAPKEKEGIPSDRLSWDLRKWEKEDPKGLQQLAEKHPETFKKLEESAYSEAVKS